MNRQLSTLDYDALARDIIEHGGATVALDGTRPTSGYAVSLPGAERRVPTTDLAGALYVYVVDHGAELRQPARYLGAWLDGDDVVLDVTEVHPTEAGAILLGRLRGQDAIFNLATGETITLRHGVVAPRASADVERDRYLDEAAEAYAEAEAARYDDDPNPYHGDYSED